VKRKNYLAQLKEEERKLLEIIKELDKTLQENLY